jgi:class 3 adenylate cyclase
METPAIRYVRSPDGTNIAYWAVGDGETFMWAGEPIVSHAEAEWRSAWHRQWYEALASDFRLVKFDPRGCGLSDRNPDDLSLEARVSDVAAVADALELERFTLLGLALGGPFAIQYALEHQDRVSNLVLLDTVARIQDFYDLPESRAIAQVTTRSWELYIGAASRSWFGWDSPLAPSYADVVRASIDQPMALRVWAALRPIDLSAELSGLACPTLVIVDGDSALTSVDLARQLAASIPSASLRVIEGLPGENFDEIYRAVADFLGRTPTPGTSGPFRTVMFTDLAGSTALTQSLGDAAAQDLVRAHNNIVRPALAAHDGHEIKHTGDGIMAWFPAASNGLDCAQAIQHAVTDLANPDLGVKIGLNAGEPIAEEDDLYGTAVQIAARVTDQAAAGEIVCTDVVRLLVAGKPYLFSEREPAALKGVEEPVRLFTLGASR